MINYGFTHHHQTTLDEQLLYNHLQKLVGVSSPQEMLASFRGLFLGEQEYQVTEVWEALERIVDSESVRDRFPFIINRCCYILVNQWQKQSRLQWAIPELIDILLIQPTTLPSSWTAHRLRRLLYKFVQTDQYQALRRLANAFQDSTKPEPDCQPKLENLIVRYPYLYEHCFLTDHSEIDQRQQIRKMQEAAGRKFDRDLYQYISYQQKTTLPELGVNPPHNPTLLSDRQLSQAIDHFTGQVDGGYTYNESSRLFLKQSSKAGSYHSFKGELYEYLTSSMDGKYANRYFKRRLEQTLKNTLSHNDSHSVNSSLVAGTCKRLLDFLVVESQQKPQHFVLIDLTNNLGVTNVMGLMLKIVLVCRQTKRELEKRLAVLFTHYSNFERPQVVWLIESLENMNIAFSTHFGASAMRSLKIS